MKPLEDRGDSHLPESPTAVRMVRPWFVADELVSIVPDHEAIELEFRVAEGIPDRAAVVWARDKRRMGWVLSSEWVEFVPVNSVRAD